MNKKNIIISTISTFQPQTRIHRIPVKYKDKKLFESIHTNETAIRYIANELKNKDQKVDKIFAFVTETVLKDHWKRFKDLLSCIYYPIENLNDDEKKNYFNQFEFSQKDFDYNITGTDKDYILINEEFSEALYAPSKMFNGIKNYIKENKDSKIVVHVDTSGGFRYTSMILLVLIQILRSAGYIESNNNEDKSYILYSNMNKEYIEIEDVNNLTNMFSLVGGIRDFIDFGNMNQLQEYFGDLNELKCSLDKNKKEEYLYDEKDNRYFSKALINLLETMREFSESIKSCSKYDYLIKVLSDLHENMRNFKSMHKFGCEERNTDLNIKFEELFFFEMLPVIEEEYKEILPSRNKISDNKYIPKIIEWCIKKKMVQQATTFFVEKIPTYLKENNLIKIESKSIIDVCKNNREYWESPELYFMKKYKFIFIDLIKDEIKKYEQYNKFQDTLKKIENYENNFLKIMSKENYDIIVNQVKFRIKAKQKNRKSKNLLVNILDDKLYEKMYPNVILLIKEYDKFNNLFKHEKDKSNRIERLLSNLKDLDKDNILKKVVACNMPNLEGNEMSIKNEDNIFNIIFYQMNVLNKERAELKSIKNKRRKKEYYRKWKEYSEKMIEILNIPKNKGDGFIKLLEIGAISTKYDKNILYEIINSYSDFVKIRNNMNHGNTKINILYKDNNKKILDELSVLLKKILSK